MHKVTLFVEDVAHEAFLEALIQRIAEEHAVSVKLNVRSASGGFSKALRELKRYTRDIQGGIENAPDLLIVCTDGNCKGFTTRRQEIEREIIGFNVDVICAVPDPHIERWLLLDSKAFKNVLGKGCPAPPLKCERDLFKRKLIECIRDAGVIPLLGGIEHTRDIVSNLDLEYLEQADESLGRLLKALRNKFNEWD